MQMYQLPVSTVKVVENISSLSLSWGDEEYQGQRVERWRLKVLSTLFNLQENSP